MKTTLKVGSKVNFLVGHVSRKYGCKYGIIKEVIDIYSDGSKLYPESRYKLGAKNTHKNDLNLSTSPDFGDFYCKGFVISACNTKGQIKEDIIVTESFVAKTI